MSVKFTILVDDRTCKPNLKTEHGLGILIAGRNQTILFDAGRTSDVLMHNAHVLKKDLRSINAAILSHGHRGHAGAMLDIARQHDNLSIYAHPDALSRRWLQKPGEALEDISCQLTFKKLHDASCEIHWVTEPEMIEPWMILSGQIGGVRRGYENFVIRKDDDLVPDMFSDEICLFVKGRRGWVVVTGCCHRGLRNTLRAAKFLVRDEPIIAIFGGLHLSNWTTQEHDQLSHILGEFGNPSLYLCHCSQGPDQNILKTRFGNLVNFVSAGTEIEL